MKSKFLLTVALLLIGLGTLLVVQTASLGKLRLIFCDVGQGDGILIVTPLGKQVVVDGGPGSKIIDCLSNNMPFWDRNIEMMLLTHPQKDHMEGQVEIFARYKVEKVVYTGVKNDTDLARIWEKALLGERSQVIFANAGDVALLDNRGSTPNRGRTSNGPSIEILWPFDSAPFDKSQGKQGKPSIEYWKVNPPKDLNETSIVTRLNYGAICIYLTGDIPKEILEGIINKPCQVLKIAHHGSRTGTNETVLDKIASKLAIIQVGKNSFGHPHKEVINMLESKGIKILRNDTSGTVEVESDGKSLIIQN